MPAETEPTEPLAATPPNPPRRRPRLGIALLLFGAVFGTIAGGIYYVRSATPAAGPEQPKAAAGKLGIDAASCPAFAEIAGRFWDLKSKGTSLESTLAAIDQGSGNDERKVKLLRALAHLIYAKPVPTRELAVSNALQACRQ